MSMCCRWLSLHLFRASDQDAILTEVVSPTMRALRVGGEVRRFWFIRHWNGGPHIRLRVDCVSTVERVVEPLTASLRRFAERHPESELGPLEYGSATARIKQFEMDVSDALGVTSEAYEEYQPSNTVQIRPYAFDQLRYGGIAAAQVVERHSCLASELALSLLANTKAPGAVLTMALYLSGAAAAVLRSPERAIALYNAMSNTFWEASGSHSDTTSAPTFHCQELTPSLQCEVTFTEGGSFLASALRVGLEYQPEAFREVVIRWQSELRFCRRMLESLKECELINVDLDGLTLDFIHMMNNRLGLSVADEAEVYSTVARVLLNDFDREAR